MQITWHGLNCIRLQGKEVTILIDPVWEKSGLKLPRFQADIVLASTEQTAGVKVAGGPQLIETPGEYEIKDAFIYGIPWRNEKAKGQSVLYRVNLEGVSFGHLGGLDRVIPNNALEILEGCDVLMLPVGNPDLLSSKEAVEVISRIEPRIIIPTDIACKGLKVKREKPDAFLKELGLKGESTEKVRVTAKDLPVDERKLYLMELS